MIRKEISIDIARPVHEVFAFVDDPSKAPEWLGLCISLEQISPGPKHIGTQLHYTYRNLQSGQTGEMDGVVTAYETNKHLAMKYGDKMFEVGLDFWFSASATGTALKHIAEIEPKSFLTKLMSPMIATAMDGQLNQDMEKLKTLLESQSHS